jgi:hypothetical protein
MMAPAATATMGTECLLCGTRLVSVGRRGVVHVEELHAVPLYNPRGMGQGYLLCGDCALLTALPGGTSLN